MKVFGMICIGLCLCSAAVPIESTSTASAISGLSSTVGAGLFFVGLAVVHLVDAIKSKWRVGGATLILLGLGIGLQLFGVLG